MVTELDDKVLEAEQTEDAGTATPSGFAVHPSTEGNLRCVSAPPVPTSFPSVEGCRPQAAGWLPDEANAPEKPSELELYKYAVDVFARKNLSAAMLQAVDISTKEKIDSAAVIIHEGLQVNHWLQGFDEAPPRGYTPKAASVDALRGIRSAMGIT